MGAHTITVVAQSGEHERMTNNRSLSAFAYSKCESRSVVAVVVVWWRSSGAAWDSLERWDAAGERVLLHSRWKPFTFSRDFPYTPTLSNSKLTCNVITTI